MNTATVINAIPVNDIGTFDGVRWFRTSVEGLDFAAYTVLPKVVRYEGKTFIKMGWNSDNGSVSYKESKAIAIPA